MERHQTGWSEIHKKNVLSNLQKINLLIHVASLIRCNGKTHKCQTRLKVLEIDIGQIQKVSEKVKTEKGLKLKLYEIEIVRKSHGKWQINYCSKDNEI